jgi:hypothetical protein
MSVVFPTPGRPVMAIRPLIGIPPHSILSSMDDKLELLAIIKDELRRHPRMGPEDLRKLIAQSVFGGDHLLEDVDRFLRGLRGEWAALSGKAVDGGAIQRIDPGGKTARLHLAPCKAVGIEVSALADFLVSQPRKRGRRAVFDARWSDVIALATRARIPFDPDVLPDLATLEALPHHSAGYGFAAYRIVNDITAPGIAAQIRLWGLTE